MVNEELCLLLSELKNPSKPVLTYQSEIPQKTWTPNAIHAPSAPRFLGYVFHDNSWLDGLMQMKDVEEVNF